jgi:hypothetical protein
MPGNVEAGVVLSTNNRKLQKEWEGRLPYILPKKALGPDSDYVPAFHGDLKDDYI